MSRQGSITSKTASLPLASVSVMKVTWGGGRFCATTGDNTFKCLFVAHLICMLIEQHRRARTNDRKKNHTQLALVNSLFGLSMFVTLGHICAELKPFEAHTL